MSDTLFDLAGQRAIVTGATGGIGRAVAVELAERGVHVYAMGRNQEALRSLGQDGSGRITPCEVDLHDGAAASRAVERAIQDLGGLDILINNAGIDHQRSIEETSDDDWARVIALDLTTPFQLSREAGTALKADGGGVVINVASVLGSRAVRNNSAYVTAKHGLIGMTKALALEWARQGVRVNAVAPGFIQTEMTDSLRADADGGSRIARRVPMGRWGTPSDLVGPTIFLASPAAGFITGETLTVDGGLNAS